ncbi:MAG: hypothetical protein SNJ70_01975 [Armatimonadota bacterium]
MKPSIDSSVNLAEFGYPYILKPENKALEFCPILNDSKTDDVVKISNGDIIQIDWRQPKDVAHVVIKGNNIPSVENIDIKYFYRIWPDNGTGGWSRLDDPYLGEFVSVKKTASKINGGLKFTFAPLDKEENPNVELTDFDYRQTYKIQIAFSSDAEISEVEIYNNFCIWKKTSLKMYWKTNAENKVPYTGKIDTVNAKILNFKIDNNVVVADVLYASNPNRISSDRGMIVFRNDGWESFSVFLDDLMNETSIYVRDIDAFITLADSGITFDTWEKPADAWDATVLEKVAKMPEQSLEQVMEAIPAKDNKEIILGLPFLKQEFFITENGNLSLLAHSIRGKGKDFDRRGWNPYLVEKRKGVYSIDYVISSGKSPCFSTQEHKLEKRELEKNYLPIVHSYWKADLIEYKQSSLVTIIEGNINDDEFKRKGDETQIMLNQIELTNTSSSPQKAYVWIEISNTGKMSIDDGLLLLEGPTDGIERKEDLVPQRGYFGTNGKGCVEIVRDYVPDKPGSPNDTIRKTTDPRDVIKYEVDLAAGESHKVDFNITYIELLEKEEVEALKSFSYSQKYEETKDYWENRIAMGMTYNVPEPWLNDLYKANRWHVDITTDKDPETGLYEHYAATVVYANYINETAMVAQSLNMRGLTYEAQLLFEPYIKCQGLKMLPGNFRTQDGIYWATHPDVENERYTAQGYNMHHGWALWKIAEQYKYTKNREFINNALPGLIKGCDWITFERQATMILNPDGTKPASYGLAPAGDLEDVEEYLYWYATNAYYYVGMMAVADLLDELNHPEASRIRKDAVDYGNDILNSMKETMATSPVVKLKDGTYIPCIPPRTDVNVDRKEGWIREGLYPSLHLLDGELVEPDSTFVTWMLQQLEDRIFMSKESGYGVEDELNNFFCLGGFNLQPNLCTNMIAHLRRDEIKEFIRVFYNIFWASYYPEMVCFAEWVPDYGKGGGPLYKTPDECKFIQYMRYMIILEEGKELRLGMGVPRAWMQDGKEIELTKAMTFFGMMDIKIESHVNKGFLSAKINLPQREQPEKIVLRLRHPEEGKKFKEVTINGDLWTDINIEKELINIPFADIELQIKAKY